MSSTVEHLQQGLLGTALEGATIAERWPSSSPESVLIVELSSESVLEGWEILRGLVNETERYPLVTRAEDIDCLFLDELPHESNLAGGDYAKQVIQESRNVDGGKELLDGRNLRGNFSPLRSVRLYKGLPSVLNDTQHLFGSAPDVQEVSALIDGGTLSSDADLERWLLRWELEHFGDAALDASHTAQSDLIDFADGSQYVAVLPPTPMAWEAILHTGWYGTQHNAATKVAALKSWNERYGAELVCAFASVLSLDVARRPKDIEEAFDLAIEQDHFAPDRRILSGVSLRDYARKLLVSDRWQLLAKP